MLCDVVWTGSFQSRITTSAGRTANATRRTQDEKVKCPKSATAHSADTHTAEIVAFMCFGCILQVYGLCAVFDVLECTLPQEALTSRYLLQQPRANMVMEDIPPQGDMTDKLIAPNASVSRTWFAQAWEVASDLVLATALIWTLPLLVGVVAAIVRLLLKAM